MDANAQAPSGTSMTACQVASQATCPGFRGRAPGPSVAWRTRSLVHRCNADSSVVSPHRTGEGPSKSVVWAGSLTTRVQIRQPSRDSNPSTCTGATTEAWGGEKTVCKVLMPRLLCFVISAGVRQAPSGVSSSACLVGLDLGACESSAATLRPRQ